MLTTITITQVKTVEIIDDEYVYRLNSTIVVDEGDIEPELFLYRKGITPSDDTFEHTCTLGDRVTFSKDREGAPTIDFYRKAAATDLDYDELSLAVAEAALQLTRLQNLVTDWVAYGDSTWGETTVTEITGG